MASNIEELFSHFVAANRKPCSTQHVLIRMMEEGKEDLRINFIVGASDWPKAFGCVPHDLLIAKLTTYGLNSDLLCYVYSYLKDHKKLCLKNNEQSEFDTIISGVPKAQFSDQLYLIFFSMTFSFLFQKPPEICRW